MLIIYMFPIIYMFHFVDIGNLKTSVLSAFEQANESNETSDPERLRLWL